MFTASAVRSGKSNRRSAQTAATTSAFVVSARSGTADYPSIKFREHDAGDRLSDFPNPHAACDHGREFGCREVAHNQYRSIRPNIGLSPRRKDILCQQRNDDACV